MFVYRRVCEEYLYTSVVRRGCVQGPDTKYTDDKRRRRRTQQCSNSATVLGYDRTEYGRLISIAF